MVQVKFELSSIMFMLKAVVGTENLASEYQAENVGGRSIFILDKWKLPSLVQQDKSQNKLMSNPALIFHWGQM